MCVCLNGGGARVITIRNVIKTHSENLLEGGGDNTNGVGEFGVREEVGSSRGWLHKPFGKVVV